MKESGQKGTGQKVTHIIFGGGVIINLEESRIDIDFGEPIGIKAFVYPDVFNNYLSMNDPVSQARVIEAYGRRIEQLKEQKQQQEELRLEEAARAEAARKSKAKKPKPAASAKSAAAKQKQKQ